MIEQTASDILDLEARIADLTKQKKQKEEQLIVEAGESIRSQLADADYGCGTATVDAHGFKIKVVVSKKVSYDQEGLEQVAKMLFEKGEEPREYIKCKYDVSEAAYKAWPSSLQALFQPHRTVEPSKPKIEIERM
mgnify:CR=1 FL=1